MSDTVMLNWMIEYSAHVSHSRDGEVCNVWMPDEDGTDEPAEGYPQKCYSDPRKAIQAAMKATKGQ
jgi:hypothetical protein